MRPGGVRDDPETGATCWSLLFFCARIGPGRRDRLAQEGVKGENHGQRKPDLRCAVG